MQLLYSFIRTPHFTADERLKTSVKKKISFCVFNITNNSQITTQTNFMSAYVLIHSMPGLQTCNNTHNNGHGLKSKGHAHELTRITSYFISLGSSFTEGKFPR